MAVSPLQEEPRRGWPWGAHRLPSRASLAGGFGELSGQRAEGMGGRPWTALSWGRCQFPMALLWQVWSTGAWRWAQCWPAQGQQGSGRVLGWPAGLADGSNVDTQAPSVCNSSSWMKRRRGSVEGDELGDERALVRLWCLHSRGTAATGRRASQRPGADAREESRSSGVPERGSWRAGGTWGSWRARGPAGRGREWTPDFGRAVTDGPRQVQPGAGPSSSWRFRSLLTRI